MSPHQDPQPLEADNVRTVLVGTVLWIVALVVLIVLSVTDQVDVRGWWLGMCGYGIAMGLIGWYYCRRRDSALGRETSPKS